MKQREIEEIGMLLSVERILKEKDEFRTYLDDLSVRVMPVSEDPRGDSTGTLRKLSAEARRHGQHITASVCGLMQTKKSDDVSLCAFSQVSADSDEPADRTQLAAIPAGKYLIKRTDTFGIQDAVNCFACDNEAAASATIPYSQWHSYAMSLSLFTARQQSSVDFNKGTQEAASVAPFL